jgi:hypothetical protein
VNVEIFEMVFEPRSDYNGNKVYLIALHPSTNQKGIRCLTEIKNVSDKDM